MSRDAERIDEEIAGAGRPQRPRSLSGAYLQQAVDALSDAADPVALYRHWRERPPTTEPLTTLVAEAAQMTHVAFCRTAVLFAALAAEAYVNEFLAVHMDDAEFVRCERKPTIEKYKKWTKRAYGEIVFVADREPIPDIAELFRVRDRLVHPKPSFGDSSVLEPSDEFRRLFAPPKAAHFIVMVGGAAALMMRRAYGFDYVDPVAETVWQGRQVLYDHAASLAGIPPIEADRQQTLFPQAWGLAIIRQQRSGVADMPELSVNRIMRAKKERAAKRDK